MEMPSDYRPQLYSTSTGLPEPFPSTEPPPSHSLTVAEPNDIKRKLQSQLHRDVGLYRKSP